MLSKVYTAAISGINAYPVTVETDISHGLPAMYTVGLPSATIREARERVRSALINSGCDFPMQRITINLSPAAKRKEGSHFDLPMAIGILASNGSIESSNLKDAGFFGGLSLDGRLIAVKGALPLAMGMKESGVRRVVFPAANAAEASMVNGLDIIPAYNLSEVVAYLMGKKKIIIYNNEKIVKNEDKFDMDFSDVAGQYDAKRAIMIAAAGGGHGIYLSGAPGSGKTMLARRIPTVMPELSYEEKLELTKIYSISGLLGENEPFIEKRPFRMPYHAVTPAALLGGGHIPKPGEISLAHCGVLFLDEFPEFDKKIIELLRQPMEEGEVSVERADGRVTYPASFMFVAAGNPCKCGYFGDSAHRCICSGNELRNYQSKLSGPIADRIDIQVIVEKAQAEELEMRGEIGAAENSARSATIENTGMGRSDCLRSSAAMREVVSYALDVQKDRYKNESDALLTNAKLTGRLVAKYCPLDSSGKELLRNAYEKLGISARAYEKVIKVARTIADIEGEENIRDFHIAEALGYRVLDRIYRN